MSDNSRLHDRVALITGASRGIGAAVAKRFAAEGAHVILVARTVGGLEEVDDEIKSRGGTATLVPCDLTEFDRLDNLGPPLLERFGRLDIFVGNAAILGIMTPLAHYDAKAWAEVFDANVHANWRLMRVVEPLLRLSDAGRAILVTSAAAKNPKAYWGAYAVTKSALETGRRPTALYRHCTVEFRVRRTINDTHTAAAELGGDFIMGKGGANHVLGCLSVC